MTPADISKIEKKIGITFLNKDILITSVTHRSYLNESNQNDLQSNERLEFLGDAILQFLTSEYIYDKYEDFPEGQLTNLRSNLVNTDSLATESARLELGQYLRVSRGEQETAKDSNYILADVFESILGAIYLDQGLEISKKYLEKQLFYKCEAIVAKGQLKDAKSLYQEIAQEKFNVTPVYRLVSDEGPDHDKTFIVGAYLDNNCVSKGTGSSKRKAEQKAARKALEKQRKKK